MLHRYHSKWIH